MIKTISEGVWKRYSELLPKQRKIYEPALPANLSYEGKIDAEFDYVPSERVFECLRKWLNERGEDFVYYFLTESIQDEQTDFEVSVLHLNRSVLLGVNKGSENVIVSKDFSWAIFIDHEGSLHIAGSKRLFSLLNNCIRYE